MCGNAGEAHNYCSISYMPHTAPLFVLRPPLHEICWNRLKHLRKRLSHHRLCLPKQQRDRTAWLMRFKPSASEADLRQSGVAAGWHIVDILGGGGLQVCLCERRNVGG